MEQQVQKDKQVLQGIYLKIGDNFHNINGFGIETYAQVMQIFANLITDYNQKIAGQQQPKQEEVKDGE